MSSHGPAVPSMDQHLFQKRKLKVICIGAGFAGLILAYKYKYTIDSSFIDLVIYEKNSEVGGTWYENQYPGVACDVPSHIYTFPFAPNPDWTRFYVSGDEIQRYILSTSEKYRLKNSVQFNTRVIAATWSDEKGKWQVKLDHEGEIFEAEADVLINGSGHLNHWRWPDISGIEDFQGIRIHSAAWDAKLDWKDKRVAIIGNGSSAIQILPQMQRTAKFIKTYIRTPTWIIPNFLDDFTPEGKNFEYNEEQKRHFRDNPEELTKLRRQMEHAFNGYYQTFIANSPQQNGARAAFTELMKQKLGGDADLIEKLVPQFPVGCRRITPGDGYLEALQADNVEICLKKISRVTKSGIVCASTTGTGDEDSLSEFDIIVCATGFDVSFVPAWEMKGKNGALLSDVWKESPEGYMGIFAPQMPNYFSFTGPNSPLGHGSSIAVLDFAADYMLKWCDKISSQCIRSICVKQDVLREFNEYSQAYLKNTVWASGCSSWYKNHRADGRVTAMYGGSVLHYQALLNAFRTEDFDYTYTSPNRFSFLGNGLTKLEEDGGDLGYYLKV